MNKGDKLLMKQATRNNSRADYLHSSVYARAQNGKHIGAAGGSETFEQRQQRRREFLGSYDASHINRQAIKNRPAPKKVDFGGANPAGFDRWGKDVVK